MSDLLGQVNREYELGMMYVHPKRTQYRDRIRSWNNQSKDKINITLIANAVDTLISSSYNDGLTVKFIPRDGFFGQQQAQLLTDMARFDVSEMSYSQLQYQKEQDRYFFGVSLRIRTGWNKESNAPIFSVINPLSWIPDPFPTQNGIFDGSEFRFHGFTMRSTIFDLKDSGLYDRGGLNQVVKNYYSSQEQLNRQAYNERGNYSNTTIDNVTENFSVEIYHHYTNYKGRKYLITTDSGRHIVLRQLELKPVLKEEIENPDRIQFPVVVNYRKPQRGNPFGESVCDYLEDKQKAINILANMDVIKAKKEALGGRFLVNSRLIKNTQDLLKPSVDAQFFYLNEEEFARNPNLSIGNAMSELPQSAIKSDSPNVRQYLENEATKATGIDQIQRGIVPDKSLTATEAQQAQANSNLLSLRNQKIDAVGEKKFYFERWRAYQENFSKVDEKFIMLGTNFEYRTLSIKKDDFKTKQQPHILIGTVNELNAVDEKRRQFLSIYMPQVKVDPSKKQITKDMLEREFLRLNGYSQNEINAFVPLSKDERVSQEYLTMVNANIVPEGVFERVQDLFTLYLYIQRADDTEAKEVLLATLNTIMTESQIQGDMGALNGMASGAANMQMAQGTQQAGRKIQTRADVLPQEQTAGVIQ